MASTGSPAVPYIGSRISLISKSEVRYEGILYTISTEESTVALQNVRSFGTEGRPRDGPPIPPSDELYDYIVFRGADIKDLHVCEAPAPPSSPPKLPNDPAIISQGPPAHQMQMPPPPPPPPAAARPPSPPRAPQPQAYPQPMSPGRGHPMTAPDAPSSAPHSRNDRPEHSHGGGQSRRGRGRGHSGHAPGTGQSLLNRRVRGMAHDSAPEAVEGEFNFEEHNLGFEKEKEMAKLSINDTLPTPQSTAVYNKESSFFDSLSCDTLDRLEGKDGRLRPADERRLNTETFGAVGLNDNRRHYGRGRGRGGRGRGGGGDGQYHNNYRGGSSRGGGSGYRGNRRGGYGGRGGSYNRDGGQSFQPRTTST